MIRRSLNPNGFIQLYAQVKGSIQVYLERWVYRGAKHKMSYHLRNS